MIPPKIKNAFGTRLMTSGLKMATFVKRIILLTYSVKLGWLFGLIRAVWTGVNTRAPRPYPAAISPTIIERCSGNH